MTDPLTIEGVRRTGMRLLGATTLSLAVVTLGGALAGRTAAGLTAAGVALALAVLSVRLARKPRTDPAARLITSLSALTIPALMLVAARGQLWPVDLPMLFYAVLAMVVLLFDWRAIAAGTLVVAMDHLVLGMIVPEWVSGGGFAATGQILLHAIILLTEAGALVWLSVRAVTLRTTDDAADQPVARRTPW